MMRCPTAVDVQVRSLTGADGSNRIEGFDGEWSVRLTRVGGRRRWTIQKEHFVYEIRQMINMFCFVRRLRLIDESICMCRWVRRIFRCF